MNEPVCIAGVSIGPQNDATILGVGYIIPFILPKKLDILVGELP